jgi:hypothetical protein
MTMQQPTRTTPSPKKPKFMDTKVLIAALSLAVTLGLWNILSNQAVQAEKAVPTQAVNLPPQPPANAAQGFPPLPTLIPLVNVTGGQANPQQAAAGAAAPQGGSQATQLRSVDAPSLVIQQKGKPRIDQEVLVSGGGGGGSSGPSAVTSTRSSRR